MSCHFTFIGIVWLIVVLTLRLATTFSSGDLYYSDYYHLRCNTTQFNCEMRCDEAFTCIAYYSFCFFQMVVAASPSAFYLQWANCKTSLNQRRVHQPVHLAQRIKRDGLVAAYLLQLLVRATVECVLLYFQCQLFGTEVPEIYQCAVADAVADAERTDRALVCSVDRPEQKTRHLLIMYTISAISLLLTVIDSAYLLLRPVCIRDSGEGTSGNDQPAGTRRGGDAAEGEEEGLLLL